MRGTRGTTDSEACLLVYSGVGKSLIFPIRPFCVTQVPEAGQRVRDLKVKAGMQRAPLEDTLNVLPQQTRPEPHRKAGVDLQSSEPKLA